MRKSTMFVFFVFLSVVNASSPLDTLIIYEGDTVNTIDPGVTYDYTSGQIVENVYDRLLSYDGGNLRKYKPQLAEKWSIRNSGKTYIFNLRRKVRFHSGNVFSCKDVEYSIERNLVTNSGASGNWLLAESLLGTSKNGKDDPRLTWDKINDSVSCINEYIVRFDLPEVDPAFLAKLAFVGQSIVDKKWAQEIGEWDGQESSWKAWIGKDLSDSQLNRKPSGTGAYKIVKRDAGSVLASRFTDYWGDAPEIEKVILKTVPELSSRQQAFLKGEVDIIQGGGRTIDEIQIKNKKGVVWIDDLPNLSAPVIFMNGNIKNPRILGSGRLDGRGIPRNFFSDVNVRRGFSFAFNAKKYIDDIEKGKGQVRTMLLPDSFPGYDSKVPIYNYNLDKARKEFKKAWKGDLWKKGFVLVAMYTQDDSNAQAMMEILKEDIESINPNFRIKLVAQKFSDLLSDNKRGRLAMTNGSWTPDYADPDNFMYTFYSSKGYYHPRIGWKNDVIDHILEKARLTTNMSERSSLYRRVARIAHQDAPYIIVPASKNYMFFSDKIKGASRKNYNPILSFRLGNYWKNLRKQ